MLTMLREGFGGNKPMQRGLTSQVTRKQAHTHNRSLMLTPTLNLSLKFTRTFTHAHTHTHNQPDTDVYITTQHTQKHWDGCEKCQTRDMLLPAKHFTETPHTKGDVLLKGAIEGTIWGTPRELQRTIWNAQ